MNPQHLRDFLQQKIAMPSSDILGAEIEGIDLTTCTTENLAQLKKMMLRHKVVLARGQALSPSDSINIANNIGLPVRHVLSDYHLPGHPEIMLLSNKRENGRPVGIEDAGRIWHSDMSFTEHPPAATMLYALEVPERGGETLFVDMTKAYRELPLSLRAVVDSSEGVFSYLPSYQRKCLANPNRRPLTQEEIASLGDVYHPLKLVHPETREPALYCNEAHTTAIRDHLPGQSERELRTLLDHCYRNGPDYTHRWRAGDLLLWDNRLVVHRGTPYDMSETRHLYRASMEGARQ